MEEMMNWNAAVIMDKKLNEVLFDAGQLPVWAVNKATQWLAPKVCIPQHDSFKFTTVHDLLILVAVS